MNGCSEHLKDHHHGEGKRTVGVRNTGHEGGLGQSDLSTPGREREEGKIFGELERF